MPLRLFLDGLTYRGFPRGLDISQSNDENIFRVDDPRAGRRILRVTIFGRGTCYRLALHRAKEWDLGMSFEKRAANRTNMAAKTTQDEGSLYNLQRLQEKADR